MASKEALFAADLDNLQKKVGVLRASLTSPEMADGLKKNGQALYTLTKIEAKLAAIVLAVAALKQAGVAAAGALRFAKDAAGAAAAIVAIPEDMATFASQFKAAIPTIGAAGAPVLAAALDVAKAAMKLTTDLRTP